MEWRYCYIRGETQAITHTHTHTQLFSNRGCGMNFTMQRATGSTPNNNIEVPYCNGQHAGTATTTKRKGKLHPLSRLPTVPTRVLSKRARNDRQPRETGFCRPQTILHHPSHPVTRASIRSWATAKAATPKEQRGLFRERKHRGRSRAMPTPSSTSTSIGIVPRLRPSPRPCQIYLNPVN